VRDGPFEPTAVVPEQTVCPHHLIRFKEKDVPMPTALLHVKGIGPATADTLTDAGITTVDQLAALTPEQLADVPGFGEARARQVIAHARQLSAAEAEEGADADAPQPESTADTPLKQAGGKKDKKKTKKKSDKQSDKKAAVNKTKKPKAKKAKSEKAGKSKDKKQKDKAGKKAQAKKAADKKKSKKKEKR
jgi:hypothetical protein